VTSANGVVTTYAMDPNHMARPASIATTAGWSTGAYAYDGAGNVTRIGNGRFLYDGVSRLLQGVTVTTPADSTTTRTQTVGYDLYGNIQSITTNGSTLNTPTNSANRLTSSGTAYDAAGNLITWNWGNTYQYDPFGLLWHYTSGAEDWLYMYTADDQRVWAYRTGGSGNYWAIRDLDGKVLREYSTHAGWTVDRDYVYRGDKLLAAVTPQGTRHFHLDHLGSVRQVTNASAAQVAFHAYYPFGREATTLGQDNKEQMQFTGHERDLQNTTAGTNSDADDLDYMHARYYNMHVGRFLTPDPVDGATPRRPQSWNKYGYARSSPLTLVDPTGGVEVHFTFNSFIPTDQLQVPLYGTFDGDGAGFSSTRSSARIQQRITIETDPRLAVNPLIHHEVNIGRTVLTTAGSALRVAEASDRGVAAEARRLADGTVLLEARGHASNPLVRGAPAIKYAYRIAITTNGMVLCLSCSHDRFPAYDAYISVAGGRPGAAFQHNPSSFFGPLALFPFVPNRSISGLIYGGDVYLDGVYIPALPGRR
jgi:RHS repeat-associated protein